jgi:cytosine/uracil/thiamine/allantoin permease
MSTIADSHLSNADLAPTGRERRTWGTYNVAALWMGLSIVITTYTLASGLIALAAVAAGVIPVLPGFLHAATTEGGVVADPDFFDQLYRYGVFVAFGLSAIAYVALARAQSGAREPATATVD